MHWAYLFLFCSVTDFGPANFCQHPIDIPGGHPARTIIAPDSNTAESRPNQEHGVHQHSTINELPKKHFRNLVRNEILQRGRCHTLLRTCNTIRETSAEVVSSNDLEFSLKLVIPFILLATALSSEQAAMICKSPHRYRPA